MYKSVGHFSFAFGGWNEIFLLPWNLLGKLKFYSMEILFVFDLIMEGFFLKNRSRAIRKRRHDFEGCFGNFWVKHFKNPNFYWTSKWTIGRETKAQIPFFHGYLLLPPPLLIFVEDSSLIISNKDCKTIFQRNFQFTIFNLNDFPINSYIYCHVEVWRRFI